MVAPSLARWMTFGLWAVVAACAAFWGFKVFVQPLPQPATTRTVADAQALRGDLERVLGSGPVADVEAPVVVAAASRFKLIGVVAPKSPAAADEGLALIAVDGKPAKAFRVGAAVDGDLVLRRVHARGADLGARDASTAAVALDVPPLPPPATGRPGVAGGLPMVAVPRPPQQPVTLPQRARPMPEVSVPEPLGEDDAALLAEEIVADELAPADASQVPGLATQ